MGVVLSLFQIKDKAMKFLLQMLLFFCIGTTFSQTKYAELTPQGFAPVTFETPNKTNEKLIEAARGWADYYNKKGYDVYDVTENSLKIDAWRENGYFTRSLGERYDFNIKYTLLIDFQADKKYTLTFILKEVYNKTVLSKTTVADFFTPDGKLKEDFEEVKPSLEATANRIMKSFADFIDN